MVTQRVCLEYPNGRVHERSVRLEQELRPGSEFELFGRRWRVQHVLPEDRRNPAPRFVCASVGTLSGGLRRLAAG